MSELSVNHVFRKLIDDAGGSDVTEGHAACTASLSRTWSVLDGKERGEEPATPKLPDGISERRHSLACSSSSCYCDRVKDVST